MHWTQDEDAPVGALLVQVSRLLREAVRTRMTQIGLHRGQAFVLRHLAHHDGSPQHHLADGVHIRPATLTPMLQKLEGLGWINRKSDPQDQRISRVYLTEAGRSKQREVEAVFLGIEADLEALFSPQNREQFRQHLLAVRQGFRGSHPADPDAAVRKPPSCGTPECKEETI